MSEYSALRRFGMPLRCLLVLLLCCCRGLPVQLPVEPDCASSGSRSAVQLHIRGERNESGQWTSSVAGRREVDNRTDAVTMDFKQRVVECGATQTIYFEGRVGETSVEDRADRLTFHPNCGSNVAITNKGRTMQKINGEERFNGVAYTSRPLRPDEAFVVRVDWRSGTKFNYFMGMGVTTTTPHDGEIGNHINAFKPDTWVMYHNDVYHNGTLILGKRPYHLDHLKAGDRIGVKRTESGALIAIVNGKEHAIASRVPPSVYGAFECYGDASQVTIV